MDVRARLLLVLVLAAAAGCASTVTPPAPTEVRATSLPVTVVPSPTDIESASPATSPGPSPSVVSSPTPIPTVVASATAVATSRPLPSASPTPAPTPAVPPTVTLGPEVRPIPGAYHWLTAAGPPDARASRDGIRLELWVPHREVAVSRWMTIHLRITNTTSRTFWMDCAPVGAGIDVAGMFDPGRAWSGKVAAFKRRAIAENGMLSVGFRYRTGEGINCLGGDVGLTDEFRAGQVLDIDLAALPRYFLGNQALPGGKVALVAGFSYQRTYLASPPWPQISVSSPVTLERRPFPWPSPGQIVDTVIETPGFLDWLKTRSVPGQWDNTELMLPLGSSAFEECFFGFTGLAPNGTLTLGVFAYPPGSDTDPNPSIWGGSLIDPWTLTSFAFATRHPRDGCPGGS